MPVVEKSITTAKIQTVYDLNKTAASGRVKPRTNAEMRTKFRFNIILKIRAIIEKMNLVE